MTAPVNVLLFDWDGTLVDSAELGLVAFKQSFAALGVDFDAELYREVYSPNWYSIYEAMGLPKDKWQQADELWVENYGEQIAQPVAGARETLSELKQKHYRLGVVSSGSECRVAREVTELDLDSLFDIVICNEQMAHKKPHPEGLETAIQTLGCSREESCYIGDSPEDVEMGRRANILTVGVLSAYPTSWRLENHRPHIFIKSINELLDHF